MAYSYIYWILILASYVYFGFAYMAISKKLKQSSPGLAWIPIIGPWIVVYKASKMHWWPFLLIIGFVIPIVNIIASIIFAVYVVIWTWKTFEACKYPGWWSILTLFPILNYIFAGIVAWGKK